MDEQERLERNFQEQANSKTFQNIIKTYDLNKKSVFDIGCSYGEHLALFGPGSLGITLRDYEIEVGQKRGLNIIKGNIESDTFKIDQKFDVIYANNLLEHLYSPHYFLCKIKKYLNKDGFIIIGVPCLPLIRFLMRFRKFQGCLSVAHINFFTKHTLALTIQKSGWIISSIRGFRLKNKFLDKLLDLIYPHFYITATPDPNFKYHEHRLQELIGYININQ